MGLLGSSGGFTSESLSGFSSYYEAGSLPGEA